MINLSGKVALVTGGAVGKELASGFLQAGANVAFIHRDPSRKQKLEKDFADFADVFVPVQADLTSRAKANAAVSAVKERFGGIDFLLNSLGGWIGGKKLHEHTDAELEKILSMDLTPTFNIMSAVLPAMVEQRFGRIVNFISLQVFGSGAGSSVYAASKSAVLALTRAAAEEYRNYGIAAYAVAPSTIDTENNRKWMPGADTEKWVKISEIVDAILFLCGTGDSLNGTVLKFPGKL